MQVAYTPHPVNNGCLEICRSGCRPVSEVLGECTLCVCVFVLVCACLSVFVSMCVWEGRSYWNLSVCVRECLCACTDLCVCVRVRVFGGRTQKTTDWDPEGRLADPVWLQSSVLYPTCLYTTGSRLLHQPTLSFHTRTVYIVYIYNQFLSFSLSKKALTWFMLLVFCSLYVSAVHIYYIYMSCYDDWVDCNL